MGVSKSHQLTRKGKSMAILYVGIDLAKNVFAIHGVDEHGKAVLVRPSVPRARLHQLVAALPPCTIGMEACSGAHHWARLFAQHGHTCLLYTSDAADERSSVDLGGRRIIKKKKKE